MALDRARIRREARLACLPLPIAELEQRGVTRAQTSYGCYVPANSGMTDGARSPLQRIVEAIRLVPEQGAFTGWAAAYLAGVTTLDGRDPGPCANCPCRSVLAGPPVGARVEMRSTSVTN